MQEVVALKFILACVEEAIKNILMVKKDFDIDLFKLLLKRIVYDILSNDLYSEQVGEIISKSTIGYDLSDDRSKDELDENDDIENYEITIDIPIGSILSAILRMIERGELEDIYTEREMNRDLGLIGDIWENWIPIDDYGLISKGMVDFLIENMG